MTPPFGCLSAPGDFVCLLSSVVRWAVRIAGHADRPAAPPDSPTAEGDALWDHHRLLWQRKGNISLSYLSLWGPWPWRRVVPSHTLHPIRLVSSLSQFWVLSLCSTFSPPPFKASSLFTWILNGFWAVCLFPLLSPTDHPLYTIWFPHSTRMITQVFPWPVRPHMSCLLTASLVSVLLAPACPHAICQTLFHIREFALASPILAHVSSVAFHGRLLLQTSELCSDVMSSRTPSLTNLDKTDSCPESPLLPPQNTCHYQTLPCSFCSYIHCLASHSRIPWTQRHVHCWMSSG